jgi:hypothetical protein
MVAGGPFGKTTDHETEKRAKEVGGHGTSRKDAMAEILQSIRSIIADDVAAATYEVRPVPLVATNYDVRITGIKMICATAILVAFSLLLYLRGVTLSTTTIAEIILSVVIGIAARVLVSLSPFDTFATGEPVTDTQKVSLSQSNESVPVDTRQTQQRGRPAKRSPTGPAERE